MTRDPPRSDDDLAERIDELEAALADLRSDLREESRPGLRPPSPSEFFRFTEEYTIPTVIATLEATIQALKLFQGVLRLANPDRGLDAGARDARDRFSGPRAQATDQLTRSLSELRRALSSANFPEDETSRSLVEDARDLSAEIEDLLDDATRTADETRDRRRREDDVDSADRRESADRPRSEDAITIDVTDPDEESTDSSADGHSADADDDPQVDVDAELRSIKDDVKGPAGSDENDNSNGSNANSIDATDEVDDADTGDSEADGNGEGRGGNDGGTDGNDERTDGNDNSLDDNADENDDDSS